MEVIDPQALEPARSWAAEVTEVSQVAEVRRRATGLARRQGFGDTREGELALIVTEAATNLVKHGREGQLVVAPLERGGRHGIDVLALDRGPGMANVQECLVDGFSTRGTPGNGLGAIRRLADDFDVHSMPDRGTALLARLWAEERPRRDVDVAEARLEVGGVCLPISGEDVPGDAWTFVDDASTARLFVVDGLGHGPVAAEAADAAVTAFRAHAARPLVEILEVVHDALRATRGAVAGVADLDPVRGVVRFAGIGNIAGAVSLPGRQKNLVSLGGTMGHVVPKVREFTYEWPPEALLVLHSDGLGTKWSIDDYRGLAGRDATLVAGVLYRDYARGRDDVTVVVARRRSPP